MLATGVFLLVAQTANPPPVPYARDVPMPPPRVYPPPAPPLPSAEYQGPVRLNTNLPLIGEDDYPTAAMFNDAAGVTELMLSIGTKGRATACAVTASSGFPQLDITACALVRQRARFTPATLGGRPVEGRWRSRIVWKLPDESHVMLDPAQTGTAKIKVQPRDAFLEIDPRLSAQRAGVAGVAGQTSFVALDTDTGGRVMRCTLTGGNADPAQAGHACKLFQGQRLFIPAFDANGNAVPDRVRVKVRW